jgi:quinoprotein glucose dehydrogenase
MILGLALVSGAAPARAAATPPVFSRTNLVAWCIVPFDARGRGPEARAQMLDRLGFRRLAYDWRAEHVPTFDAEVEAMQRHGIELTAWWFPGTLDADASNILAVIERHGIHPQLWVTGGGGPTPTAAALQAQVTSEAQRIRPLALAAARLGCAVGLYNHGGWFGEPENQIRILDELRTGGLTNVGLVYNFHHGHDHLDRFPDLWRRMQPHLLAVNLNGMIAGGEARGLKILHLGEGDRDADLLRMIRDSGWQGPVGILDHRPETDSEETLSRNLVGLDWLLRELDQPGSGGPKPRPPAATPPAPALPSPTTGQAALPAAFGPALKGGRVVPGGDEFRTLPLTVECRARLHSRQNFNLLVACDPKSSARHWELYSYAGTGALSLYLPGRGGEFQSGVNVADDRWHHLAAVLETDRVRLFVDGALVLDTPTRPLTGTAVDGDLAFGRLVEGGLGCDGWLDNVRLSRGVRIPTPESEGPAVRDATTLGLWDFDETGGATAAADAPVPGPYWAVEDAAARAALPEFETVPAAEPSTLTPASGHPRTEVHRTWQRSHGNAHGTRFSALDQIHRGNVTHLQVAWTYRAGDGVGNLQCNPIIVGRLLLAPTPGQHLVAVDAATGAERWRFKPAGRPAFRGLEFWPGDGAAPARVLFCAGAFLYALDPDRGTPVATFGEAGRVRLPGTPQGDFGAATAAPAVFERIVVVPGFEKDVWGLDVVTGRLLWTFHTVPVRGEFGHDTWDRPEAYSANCWGGMALDDQRGIAYVTTGSPKPNFVGVEHRGRNLFANCLIALDARTGQRLWHFQEIPHDLWDLDLPAPPNLTTITRDGRRVDVVAATSKTGNTLLLDRVSGRPIFPFRYRRAPASDLPGELTWPYQPDPELPEPFARVAFALEDVTDRSEEANEVVLARAKGANLGAFRPFTAGRPNIFFGIHGGAEWTGACVDPGNGRLYVSANHIPWIIAVFRDDEPPYDPNAPKTRGQEAFERICAPCHGADRVGVGTAPPLRGLRHRLQPADVVRQVREGRNAMPAQSPEALNDADLAALVDYLFLRDRVVPNTPPGERPRYSSTGYPKLLDHEGYPGSRPPWGTLNCLDLNTGRLCWKVPLGEYPELTAEGLPKTGTENFGGPIVTAGGLVFCAGTRDPKLRAFDAGTGRELWAGALPFVGSAPPATYEVDGRQFVVVPATGGGKLGSPPGDAYVAFALPETAVTAR